MEQNLPRLRDSVGGSRQGWRLVGAPVPPKVLVLRPPGYINLFINFATLNF